MIKIPFVDHIAEFMNRIRLTQVSGTNDTFEVEHIYGDIEQQGSRVSATTLNDMQDNIENAIYETSQIYKVYASNNVIVTLHIPEGANPNRITIISDSSITATARIMLQVGENTAAPLIWIKPDGGEAMVLSLLANTPYDLIWNGSAWIVKDYAETTGTWTPTIYTQSGSGTVNYTLREGKWFTQGNLVYVAFRLGFTASGFTGTNRLFISGLPFPAAHDTYTIPLINAGFAPLTAGSFVVGATFANDTNIGLLEKSPNSFGAYNNTSLGSGNMYLYGNLTYIKN